MRSDNFTSVLQHHLRQVNVTSLVAARPRPTFAAVIPILVALLRGFDSAQAAANRHLSAKLRIVPEKSSFWKPSVVA
jgi:hypothetical protein